MERGDGYRDVIYVMYKNDVWELIDLPKDAKVIDSMWVYNVKSNSNNKEVFKARLVARGFMQENLDEKVYSPVAQMSTLRTLVSVANKFNLDIKQMDVKTAFLYGLIEEEIYVST